MPIRSIYGLCVTSTRSIAGEQSFLFWFKAISLSFFFFFFFYTIDRICLALSDTHTRINPFQAVARADRNPLQDDDLSRCGTSQDYDKTLHSRFMFSYRDIRVKVTGHETKE